MTSPQELENWVDASATTALLVRVRGETVIEINRPLEGDGWYGIDGLPHPGVLDSGVGLPYERLSDGRMRHDVASAQKSVVGVLVAIAADRGIISIDDPVSRHLGDGWSRADLEHEQVITIRHLLSMTSGLNDSLEYEVPPGIRWRYSLGPAWHLLKPLLAAASGMTLEGLTQGWLTGPLEMHESTWIERPGMAYLDGRPFEALLTSARDLGQFGQMVLDGGRCGENRVVSEAGLAALLTPSQPHNMAYGLLWWLNGQQPHLRPMNDHPIDDVLLPSAPPDTVAALGALGQMCIVSPSQAKVVVRLGATPPGTDMVTGASMADEVWSNSTR